MRLILALFMTFSVTTTGFASDTASENIPHKFQFIDSNSVMKDVDNTLLLAKKNNKKALLVLGAQWCHDSRSLATKFSSNEMQTILNTHYEVLFIDVGYLSKGFDVVKRFGMPIYYGTPTVMIIDPKSDKLMNEESMMQWMSADSIELSHYQTYFSDTANNSLNMQLLNTPRLQQYYQEINAFELVHATRIKAAYKILGLALEDDKENDIKFSDESIKKWNVVRKLRSQLPADMIALKKQAQKAVLEELPLTLVFPTYSTFEWE